MFNSFCTLGSPLLAVKAAAPIPQTPTDFTVSTSASFATLNFTVPAGATSYTVTATPTTNIYEVPVVRTFSSGTGYKLEVLSPNTTYTFALVAKNNSGSSAAATVSASTKTATVSGTITYTKSTQNFSTTASAFVYTYIASPKTSPNIVYVLTFENSPRLTLYYSTDSGTSFTEIGSRLKWNPTTGADQYGAGLCCSDDGKYVYVQPYYRYVNISTDYGATFNFSKSPSSNMTAHSALTNPTGEVYMVGGTGETPYGTTNSVVHWSNNSNSTYKYRTLAGNNPMGADFSNNIVYYANSSTLLSYNAGTKANLLSFDFSTVTFASTTTLGGTNLSTIGKIASEGGITVIGCANAPKIRLSTNGGSTFTNVAYFNTGAGNIVTMNLQSTITIEPYSGFIMVHDRESPSRFFYSSDRGTNWQQYTPSPAIGNASASSCVVKDSSLIVNIVSNNEFHIFTIPITVV
jgi:hypothetical protein